MEEKRSFRKKVEDFFAGRGFYIVLILCVAAIGASAWVIMNSGGVLPEDSAADTEVSMADEVRPPVVVDRQPEKAAEETPPAQTPADVPLDVPAGDTVETAAPAQTIPEDGGEEDVPETAPPAAPAAPTALSWPVRGSVSFDYAMDTLVYHKTMADWRVHTGVDLEAALGERVLAAAAGTVTAVEADDLLGTVVVIDHGGGLSTRYANLAGVPTVTAGDTVAAGDVIGSVGDTAIGESSEVCHLHFEVLRDGEPVDPMELLEE